MPSFRVICAACAALAGAAPALANAAFVLDTGTPTGTGAPVVLNTTQSFAAEFAVTSGETLTSLSAYVTAGADQPGALFEFSIYSNAAGFIGARNLPAPVFTTAATFSANGWNGVSIDWAPSTPGDYWLVVGAASSGTNPGLDLPLETSATTGTAPALNFAYASGTNAKYTQSSNYPIGVEITGVGATPLPPGVWLFLSGLGGLVWFARQRSRQARPGRLDLARC